MGEKERRREAREKENHLYEKGTSTGLPPARLPEPKSQVCALYLESNPTPVVGKLRLASHMRLFGPLSVALPKP